MHTLTRATLLAQLLIKEQFKEPIALFWILLSPGAIFHLLAFSKGHIYFQQDYRSATAWFYAYIALSIAFFGFSFYIVGRRESGFMRSFIYTPHAKFVFLSAQFMAYSSIAFIYCLVFYLITRLPFGAYSIHEILIIAARFYCCFIVFCIPGLLLTLLPLNFQTANTVFSIASFFMLALGIAQSAFPENTRALFNTLNLLSLGKAIMADGIQTYRITIISAFIIFVITMKSVCKHLRINPVWSRY